MKQCVKCNKEYNDELNFCSTCGSALSIKPQEYFCPSCNKSLGESFDKFCPYCGTRFIGQATDDNSKSQQHESHVNAKQDFNQANDVFTKKSNGFSIGYVFSKECMFSPDGRRGRMGYWGMCFLISAIIGLITGISSAVFTPDTAIMVTGLAGLLMCYPMYCNVAKRMHDLDKPTSWAVLLMVLSFVSAFFPMMNIFLIVLGCYPAFFRGTDGSNQFGDDPTKF